MNWHASLITKRDELAPLVFCRNEYWSSIYLGMIFSFYYFSGPHERRTFLVFFFYILLLVNRRSSRDDDGASPSNIARMYACMRERWKWHSSKATRTWRTRSLTTQWKQTRLMLVHDQKWRMVPGIVYSVIKLDSVGACCTMTRFVVAKWRPP
jgi:hypothetical protein